VGQKIGLGYTLALSIAILGTAAGFVLGDYYQRRALELKDDAREEIELVNQLRIVALTVEQHQHHLIYAIEQPDLLREEYTHLLDHLANFRAVWAKFKSLQGAATGNQAVDPAEELETIQQFIQANQAIPERYLQQLDRLLRQLDLKNLQSEQIPTVRQQLIDFDQQVMNVGLIHFSHQLLQLTQRGNVEYQEAESRLEDAYTLRLQIIVISTLLSIAIAALSAYYTSRMITQPLQAVTAVAQQATREANFDLQAPVSTQDEVGVLANSLNQLTQRVKQLLNAEAEASTQLEMYSQMLEQQVQKRTQELSETLEHLKTAQAELVQSEKMAALGQLLTGVAHEINSPLGAIQASNTNIDAALEKSLQSLPKLLQRLPIDRLSDLFALLDLACRPKPLLSFREERQLKRSLKQYLETNDVENAANLADPLSKMGITITELNTLLPLLQTPDSSLMVNTAHHLAMLKNNSQNIHLAIQRAARIVSALKVYAHRDSTGEMMQASVTEGIDIVLTLYHNQLKHNVEVTKNYEPVPPILCHAEELMQVWTNLLHNAIQAMNDGGQLKITVTEKPGLAGDRFIVVFITDSGCGIPSEIQSRIFEPFFTTKPLGEGSGLGLDIVQRIVSKHQGKVEVASQPGHTTFSVWLPVVPIAT
jgi:C4-dicarboxylate-specific signal transduction histidine kinase